MGALFQGSGLDVQRSAESVKRPCSVRRHGVGHGHRHANGAGFGSGAAKGNFTMMDNLGVSMNATTIQAYAAAKGLDFVWASASNAEKAEVAHANVL
jgi:hypothetical protein